MKDLKNDFEAFKTDNHPAARISLLEKIHTQLPVSSLGISAAKLGVAHLFSSLVVLASCEQFGVRLFFQGPGLMRYFMKISPTFCYSFCGALYLAVTFLFARFFLSQDEWLLILRSKVLTIMSVTLLSLGALMMISHEVSFQAGLLWIFGAVVGAELASLRRHTVRQFFRNI